MPTEDVDRGRVNTCGVRDKYAALYTNGACTMQQFMWQLDITGVAHFVMDCFDVLDDIPSNQP